MSEYLHTTCVLLSVHWYADGATLTTSSLGCTLLHMWASNKPPSKAPATTNLIVPAGGSISTTFLTIVNSALLQVGVRTRDARICFLTFCQ